MVVVTYYLKTMTRPGARNGQTLGKQLVGIRVVRDDGYPVSAGTVMRREVLIKGLLSWFTLGVFELVDCLWPLGDATNRALHDKIVGTHVYIDPARSRRGRTVFTIIGIALVAPLVLGVLAAIAIPTFLNQRVNAQQNAAQVEGLEHDMGAAFAAEREAGLRNNPPALDTGTQLVGDIGTARRNFRTPCQAAPTPVAAPRRRHLPRGDHADRVRGGGLHGRWHSRSLRGDERRRRLHRNRRLTPQRRRPLQVRLLDRRTRMNADHS